MEKDSKESKEPVAEKEVKEPSSPNNDEFELTAEMMVNDFDDERTLDEEEALAEGDADQDNELSNLEKEKDMPISTLLAMYGYNENNPDASSSSSSSDEASIQDPTKEEDVDENMMDVSDANICKSEEVEEDTINHKDSDNEEEDDQEEEKSRRSMLHELYTNDASGNPAPRHLRSGSGQQSEEDEEDEDGDYSPDEDDWKKTIMVGSEYQAVIPEGFSTYDDAMPYENEDKLLWDPIDLPEKDVKDYLTAIQDNQNSSASGLNAIPKGLHVRDDEQALFLLLQCGNSTEEALRRVTLNNSMSSADSMSLWSEEECRNFETGLRTYAKNFHQIQQNKVRTRSVNELVQFYYLWKKTERHDVFANKLRLEKKKNTVHPGTTDFMERFLDDQDSPVPSPNVHSLLSGDSKRLRSSPTSFTDSAEQISYEDANNLSNEIQDLARQLGNDGISFLSGFRAVVCTPSNNKSRMSPTNGVTSSQAEAMPCVPASHGPTQDVQEPLVNSTTITPQCNQ